MRHDLSGENTRTGGSTALSPLHSGDGASSTVTLQQAKETGRPIILCPSKQATEYLQNLGASAIYLPETVSRVEPHIIAGTYALVLPRNHPAGVRWSEDLAGSLLKDAVISKVLLLPVPKGQDAAWWFLNGGTLQQLGELETLTPAYEPRQEPKLSQGDWLVRYCMDNIVLHYTPAGDAIAQYDYNDVRIVSRIASRAFTDFLNAAYHARFGKPPGREAIQTAKAALGSLARMEGERQDAYIRVGVHEGIFYLDLCNDKWEVVQIHPQQGYQVVRNSGVLFHRPPDAGALPHPAPKGDRTSAELAQRGLEVLKRYVRLSCRGDYLLLWGFLVHALSTEGPFPHLSLMGEQGTGKTLVTEFIRSTIDPVERAKTRSLPSTTRELMIGTRGVYLLAFDNVSRIPEAMSDALCRLSTGSGHTERRLHTDDEEELFYAMRPFITNGIVDTVDRPDLASRTFTLRLQRVEKPEEPRVLWPRFWADLPEILAGLLECARLATTAARYDDTAPVTRLVTFERWAAFSAVLLEGKGGAQMLRDALAENQQGALREAADSDTVVNLIDALVQKGPWEGSMTELREALLGQLSDGRPPRYFPGDARALSAYLTRKASVLRTIGIEVESLGWVGRSRKRTYRLSLNSSSTSKEEN